MLYPVPMSTQLTTLLAATALMLSCSGTSEPSPAPAPEAEKPDIILVVVDTLRADHLGMYGYGRPTSPNIDKMSAEGMWFSRAYAQSGWTLASFSSLFTGKLPHEHCVGRNPLDARRFGVLSDETVTLAEALSDAGYATAAVMNNTFLAPEFNIHQGFGEEYFWEGALNDKIRSATDSVKLGMEWLQAQDEPAFLVVHMMEPHLDYYAPEPFRGQFLPEPPFPTPLADPRELLKAGINTLTPEFIDAVKAVYDEEILAVDAAVGELREALDGRERPTYTILTADHGEEFWDHNSFEHGHTLFSELTRIPLVMTGPQLPASGRVDGIVQHLDLFQTIISLSGAPPPAGSSGIDLFTLVQDGIPDDRAIVNDNILYGEPQISLLTKDHRLLFNLANGSGSIWEFDENYLETGPIQGPAVTQIAQRMSAELRAKRGELKPCTPFKETILGGFEIFQQLQALGYISDSEPAP